MICSVCTKTLEVLIDLDLSPEPISYNPSGPGPVISHHKNVESFKSSLEQNCYVCTAMRDALKDDNRKDGNDAQNQVRASTVSSDCLTLSPWDVCTDRKQYVCEDNPDLRSTGLLWEAEKLGGPRTYQFSLRVHFPSAHQGATPRTSLSTYFHVEPTTAPKTSRMKRFRNFFSNRIEENRVPITLPPLGPTTASSLDLAKRWLDDCVANHQECSARVPVTGAPWYPTRLLQFTKETVKLIETKDATPTTPYMTVTHRWGFTDEKLTLNKKTYASMIGGLPLPSMPRLFRDTMIVALHLGVNYIWIDALCIMQDKDDQTDWQREASQMQNVYSNSFCNISAADATSCSDTLFSRPRDPDEEILPQKIHLNLTTAHPTSSTAFSKLARIAKGRYNFRHKTRTKSFTVAETTCWTTQVSRALVNSRAWVLQERILSPRILHFGRRQLFWECSCWEACEAFPHGKLPGVTMRWTEPPHGLKREFTCMLRHQKQPEHDDLYGLWEDLIRYYTQTSLSFGSDKLIAISGLAKLFHSLMEGDDYLAGLWRRDLEAELLWANYNPEYFGPKAITKRPEKYRAPSWSWAAVDGPIFHNCAPEGELSHDYKIHVEDVQLTYLTDDKMGQVTDGWLRLRGRLLETELVLVSCENEMVLWTVNLEGVGVLDEGVQPDQRGLNPRVLLDVVQEDFNKEREEGLLFSVVVKTGLEDEKMEMLLFKLADRVKGVFKRLGLIKVVGDAMKKRVLDVKRGLDKPSLPCAELHEDGQHSFIVI